MKNYDSRSDGNRSDDMKQILDFMLDYGGDGYLPNMGDKEDGGSGDMAYEAALRLASSDKELTSKYERIFERDLDTEWVSEIKNNTPTLRVDVWYVVDRLRDIQRAPNTLDEVREFLDELNENLDRNNKREA